MKSPVSVNVNNVSWVEPRSKEQILSPISFKLSPGKIMGIVGPNGSGKSTLLRLLYRFQKPTTGVIQINGTDIWLTTPKKVARTIAAVLQEQTSDFSLTVREIISLGRTPHKSMFGSLNDKCDEEIIESAIDRLCLIKFKDRQLSTLSGGEKQRVMVARALAQEPSLLILDEPTNHLDIRQQLEVIDLIKDLPITIVSSLHDLNMAASVCDDVLLLKEGKSVAFGHPDNVFCKSTISEAFEVKTEQESLVPSNSKHITFHLA